MNTYLLAWNPRRYPWGSIEDEIKKVRDDGSSWVRWSVGNNRSIKPGDRLFMIRLGQPPKGIVASGWAQSEPFLAPHWDLEKRAQGRMADYVDFAFDALYEVPQLPIEMLRMPPFPTYHWSTQMSGVRIPDDVAIELEAAWASAVGARGMGFPDEMALREDFPEGAATSVYVNRYERSPAARNACLSFHGRACAVCGMTFRERYGAIAASFIQVHHLMPLGQVGTEHDVDPVADLRPVCPNCHAVLHLKRPPLTIEQLRAMLGEATSEG